MISLEYTPIQDIESRYRAALIDKAVRRASSLQPSSVTPDEDVLSVLAAIIAVGVRAEFRRLVAS